MSETYKATPPPFDWVQFLCMVVALAVLFILLGCSTAGAQPAKSQTQNFDHCTFNLTFPQGTKEGAIEVANQNQYLESSGTETYSPTATPTMDVKPDTTVTLSRAGATADGLTSLVNAGVNAIKGWKSDGTAAKKTAGTGECADGSCYDDPHYCPDGNCTIEGN